MLTVKTSIRKSDINGNGLFAAEDIAKDTVLWRFVPGFDVLYRQEDIEALPIQAQTYLKQYTYGYKGKIVFSGDNDRFTNHSSDPNTAFLPDETLIAVKDIKSGTELTIDYTTFDKGFDEI